MNKYTIEELQEELKKRNMIGVEIPPLMDNDSCDSICDFWYYPPGTFGNAICTRNLGILNRNTGIISLMPGPKCPRHKGDNDGKDN